ncbi:MAG: YihY/virulence factor BrkB family protein [Xenococcaceae cyanobacterium]
MVNTPFVRFFQYLNWKTINTTFSRAMQRRLTNLSAEMAYNAMLALFPAILAILTIIGMFEGSVTSSLQNLAIRLKDIVPEQVWSLLLLCVRDIQLKQNSRLISISFIAAIWIFSGVLNAAMEAIDRMHQVPRKWRRPFWKARLIAIFLTFGTITSLIIASFLILIGDFIIKIAFEQNWGELLLITWQFLTGVIVLAIATTALFSSYQIFHLPTKPKITNRKIRAIALVFIASIVSFSIIHAFLLFIRNLIVTPEIDRTVESLLLIIWRVLSWSVALAIIAVNCALVYRFGISRWQKGTPIFPGAILAAISWAFVSFAFRFYVSHFSQYNKIYGVLGTIIIVMLWLYLSSLILLLGEQLNVTVGEAMQKNESCRTKI